MKYQAERAQKEIEETMDKKKLGIKMSHKIIIEKMIDTQKSYLIYN